LIKGSRKPAGLSWLPRLSELTCELRDVDPVTLTVVLARRSRAGLVLGSSTVLKFRLAIGFSPSKLALI
jgi:hypothetical protein